MDGENGDRFRRTDLSRPGGMEIARQLGIVAVLVVAWTGAFRFAMNLPGAEPEVRQARVAARAERPSESREGSTAVDSAGAEADVAAKTEGSAAVGAATGAAETRTGPASVGSAGTESAPARDAPPSDGTREASTVAGDGGDGGDGSTPAPAREPAAPDPAPATADPLSPPAAQAGATALAEADDLPEVSFVADVLPIMERRCVKCHGAPRSDGTPRIEEGLDLRSYDAIMAGSTWGSVVEPGDPVGSYLLELVVDGDMPDDGPRLLPREIRVLTAWIAAGAPRN